MSNSYFAFKQFRVEQNRCAMKVSTDACIQGAWTPVDGAQQILDLGAGTGLLSLMLAQRNPDARIIALERDEAAAEQACANFAASPFAERIELFHGDALHMDAAKLLSCSQRLHDNRTKAGAFAQRSFDSDLSFDLIICNPPFFQNSLKGPDAARNAARHNDTLTPRSLAELFAKHLKVGGAASIMWPPESYAHFKREALMLGLKEERVLIVRDRAGSRVTRMIGIWRKSSNHPDLVEEELFIKNEDGNYSERFIQLLKEFYLNL